MSLCKECTEKDAEIDRLRKALEAIAFSGKTKTGMKEDARRALFVAQNDQNHLAAGSGGAPI